MPRPHRRATVAYKWHRAWSHCWCELGWHSAQQIPPPLSILLVYDGSKALARKQRQKAEASGRWESLSTNMEAVESNLVGWCCPQWKGTFRVQMLSFKAQRRVRTKRRATLATPFLHSFIVSPHYRAVFIIWQNALPWLVGGQFTTFISNLMFNVFQFRSRIFLINGDLPILMLWITFSNEPSVDSSTWH